MPCVFPSQCMRGNYSVCLDSPSWLHSPPTHIIYKFTSLMENVLLIKRRSWSWAFASGAKPECGGDPAFSAVFLGCWVTFLEIWLCE